MLHYMQFWPINDILVHSFYYENLGLTTLFIYIIWLFVYSTENPNRTWHLFVHALQQLDGEGGFGGKP